MAASATKHLHQRPSRTESRTIPRPVPSMDVEYYETRLCIRNLPLETNEQALKEHLRALEGVQITDCRILKDSKGRSRRVAFLGLSSSEQAELCIRQFHKTYFHTCRISVERALKHAERSTKEDDNNQVVVDLIKSERKPNSLQDDARREEFITVLGGGNKSSGAKFWANDDGAKLTKATDEDGALNDDEQSDSDDSDSGDSADPLKTVSDVDFLRSKQVAVDDLPDHGDYEVSSSSNKNNNKNTDDDSSDVVIPKRQMEDETIDQGDTLPKQESTTTPNNNPFTRLFARNLPFDATEEDLKTMFEKYNLSPQDVYLPIDDQKRPKGFGFVTFHTGADAQRALQDVDGVDFQGRLLHLLPARPNNDDHAQDMLTDKSFKGRQQQMRATGAAQNSLGWSASHVRADAVIDTLAERLGLRKGDVMGVKDGLSSGDAAVRLALAETAVIEENRRYFAEHGIDMEALVSMTMDELDTTIERSKTAILVKNLPADTTKDELLKVFGPAGETPTSILLPPSRTIAVVEYPHGNDAKQVFRRLAYRRFKSVPLYLEWAPLAALAPSGTGLDTALTTEKPLNFEQNDEPVEVVETGPNPTAFVKNLNFSTSEDALLAFFRKEFPDTRAVRIPQKVAAAKRNVGEPESSTEAMRSLSMGYGFAEFTSFDTLRNAVQRMNGSVLDGHALELSPSRHAVVHSPASGAKGTKLVVRNVPFQSTRKELLQLFGSFGQLKKVRLPKKFDGSHRGFAFIEYLTEKEAAAGMKALARTHLYGRRLVIEWASSEDENVSELREKAKRAVSQQGTRRTKPRK